MGKSAASCFKIIACGSDSVDHADLQSPESKDSSSRSGWSFRKQSSRHRVLSNTIISHAPPCSDKESPEKASLVQVDSNPSNIVVASEEDESSAILIQAAIRGYMARRMFSNKKKKVIKLQAAVRGHLVRRRQKGNILEDSESAERPLALSTVYPGAVEVRIGGSECGTELSITSTLDSPDISEGGVYDLDLEPKILDTAEHSRSRNSLGCEGFSSSSLLGTELSYANIDQLERNETLHSELDSLEKMPESPRSHITLSESRPTPPSKVSLTPKKSSGKKKPLPADKSSASNPKRRNSTKLDCTNAALPSYMLPTESARAKLLPSGSPVSSPDVQEIKNRQESPRIHSPQERKWRR